MSAEVAIYSINVKPVEGIYRSKQHINGVRKPGSRSRQIGQPAAFSIFDCRWNIAGPSPSLRHFVSRCENLGWPMTIILAFLSLSRPVREASVVCGPYTQPNQMTTERRRHHFTADFTLVNDETAPNEHPPTNHVSNIQKQEEQMARKKKKGRSPFRRFFGNLGTVLGSSETSFYLLFSLPSPSPCFWILDGGLMFVLGAVASWEGFFVLTSLSSSDSPHS